MELALKNCLLCNCAQFEQQFENNSEKKGLWQSQYGELFEGQMRELQSTRAFVTLSDWMYMAAALRRAE